MTKNRFTSLFLSRKFVLKKKNNETYYVSNLYNRCIHSTQESITETKRYVYIKLLIFFYFSFQVSSNISPAYGYRNEILIAIVVSQFRSKVFEKSMFYSNRNVVNIKTTTIHNKGLYTVKSKHR